MSYHNFAQLFPQGQAQDRVRGSRIPSANTELHSLEEAFTSENWIIRLYKVKKPDNIGREYTAVSAFEKGHKKKAKKGGRKGRVVLREE